MKSHILETSVNGIRQSVVVTPDNYPSLFHSMRNGRGQVYPPFSRCELNHEPEKGGSFNGQAKV